MKSRLLGGVAALVLAIVGVVLLATYVQAADKRAQDGLTPVEVLVVQQPVPAGTPVDKIKDSVKTQSLPQSAVPAGAVKDLSGYAGKVASANLLPGEPLLEARLVDTAALVGPKQAAVPKGLEEVTLKLEPERMLGGNLQAGDTVGVYISYSAGAAPGTTDNPATKLEFHKVLVTKVDGVPAADSNNSGNSNKAVTTLMVTLAQSPADAQHTIHGVEFGKIYLSKENADTATAPVDQLNKDGVFK